MVFYLFRFSKKLCEPIHSFFLKLYFALTIVQRTPSEKRQLFLNDFSLPLWVTKKL
jgi:hypothetical protein